MKIIKFLSFLSSILLLSVACSKKVDKDIAYCNELRAIKPSIRIYEELNGKLFKTDTVLDGSFVVFDITPFIDDSIPFNVFKNIEWQIGVRTFTGSPKVRLRFAVGGEQEIPISVKLRFDQELSPCLLDTSQIIITSKLYVKPVNKSRIAGIFTGNNEGESGQPFIVTIKDEYRNNQFYGYWMRNINKGCYQVPIPPDQEAITPGASMIAGYSAATFSSLGKNYGCINVVGFLYLNGNKIIIEYRYANENEYGNITNPTYYNKKFIGYRN